MINVKSEILQVVIQRRGTIQLLTPLINFSSVVFNGFAYVEGLYRYAIGFVSDNPVN